MAGVWGWSELQIADNYGKPLAGAKAFFIAAATLDPIITYKDLNLGVRHANPVEADGYGIWPAVFLDEADEYFRYRITTAKGVVVRDLVTFPIIGPASAIGTTPTTPVDPNSLTRTGDVAWNGMIGPRSGYVRCNGRTIGNAISGATERQADDARALFEHAWNTYPNEACPVIGGRGSNSSADWDANKQIGTLDLRGRSLFGFDDMGNTAAGRITAQSASPNAMTPGGHGGGETVTLIGANLPAVQVTISGTTNSAGAHGHSYKRAHYENLFPAAPGGGYFRAIENQDSVTESAGTHSHTVSGQTALLGTGAPIVRMPPFVVGTYYWKL